MGQGQREGQGGVRWVGKGVPVPIWGAQSSRRRKWEGQGESSHVEKPANATRHLRKERRARDRLCIVWVLCTGLMMCVLRERERAQERKGCSLRGRLI